MGWATDRLIEPDKGQKRARRHSPSSWLSRAGGHTVAKTITSVLAGSPGGRSVLKEAWGLGQMDEETNHREVARPGVRSTRLTTGRALSRTELQRLFAPCAKDITAVGRRDAALIAVLYGAGLRRSEVTALDLGDYNPETTELGVLSGKGDKDRMCYVTDGAKAALDAWLVARGDGPGARLCPAAG